MRVFALVLALLASSAAHGQMATAVISQAVPMTTVAALPACTASTRGFLYGVTDALLPAALAAVTGGGAVVVTVFCNGTNWIVS